MIKYTISDYNKDYIDVRIKKSKQEILKAIILSFLIPILFLALKTIFFKNNINELMIIVCIGMTVLGLLTMVRISLNRLNIFKRIVKEITLDSDGNIMISTAVGIEVNEKVKNFKLYEGYKGPIKMKDIFDIESTYRIESYQNRLEFFFISSYFENWEDLKSVFLK